MAALDPVTYTRAPDERVDWVHNAPFFAVHFVPLFALVTGVTPFDVALCIGLYVFRMFCITAGYHRYFSHRAYKMGRLMQFLVAFGGATAGQKGPLWWAAHHRHHHKYSDEPEDLHSPRKGFWWSHVGWIVCKKYQGTDFEVIKDFAKYPELRLIDKYYMAPPFILGTVCWLMGGFSALVTGFFLSTVLTYHGTFVINSLAHVMGRRRYVTSDTSRNSLVLAIITLGEGWHNNHHYYQSTANQGFFWWELDISYYILRVLSALGLVWDLRTPPERLLHKNLIRDSHEQASMDAGRLDEAVSQRAGALR